MPSFILQVTTVIPDSYCSDRSATYTHTRSRLGGSREGRLCLLHGSTELHQELYRHYFYPTPSAGLTAISPHFGWSNIQVPGKTIDIRKPSTMCPSKQVRKNVYWQTQVFSFFFLKFNMVNIISFLRTKSKCFMASNRGTDNYDR